MVNLIKERLLYINLLFFIWILIQLSFVLIFWSIKEYSFDLFILMLEKYTEILFFIFTVFLFVFFNSKRYLILMFLFSIIFKVFYGFYHYYIFDYFQGYPMSMGQSYDEFTYFYFAKNFSNIVMTSSVEDMANYFNFPINYMGYPYLMSWIYHFFGVRNYYHIFINPILMSTSGVIFYNLLKESTNFKEEVLKLWLILFLFFPSFNYFSILNLKDSLLFFVLSLSFYSSWKLFVCKSKPIKLLFLIVISILVYILFYIRAPFVVLPILFLFFLIGRSFKKLLFVLIVFSGFFNLAMSFIEKVLYFFRWEYILLVFSKVQKWNITNKFCGIIPFIIIFSPLLIVFPMPVIYPLPPSIDTNISTEVFKIPINIEYSILFSFLSVLVLRKNLRIEFQRAVGIFPYFKLIFVVFMMLAISNYLTYERHKLILEMLLYLPLAFVLYNFFYGRVKAKMIFIILLGLNFLSLYYTYLRGLLKGVF